MSIVKTIFEDGKMEEAVDAFEGILCDLKEHHRDSYERAMDMLECIAYRIDAVEAKDIVRHMRPHGMKWDMDEVRALMTQKGISGNCVEYFLAMNMAYNDYMSTAKSFGQEENAEFYFSIAKDFITDEDAGKHKVAKYFMR